MIDRLYCIETDNTYPYKNLAIEEYLTMHTEPGECILFLWQNRHTVVIGKNQNAWKECKVNFLEEEGGYLVRRLSGGGAVYHDLGNLNFTFCVRKADYDLARQTEVLLEAARLLGVAAERTGRNDMTADGRKFSGNAFLEKNGFCYHHGTLLVDVDKDMMSRYLNVDKEKLESKGVSSVRSRVANLTEFVPGLTIGRTAEAMRKAFGKVYGLPVETLPENRVDMAEVGQLMKRFEAADWKYGRKIPFTYEMAGRFPWGGIALQLRVDEGKIQEAAAHSDAMDEAFISRLPGLLSGLPYEEWAICGALCGAARDKREQACGSVQNEWLAQRQPTEQDGQKLRPAAAGQAEKAAVREQMCRDLCALIREKL